MVGIDSPNTEGVISSADDLVVLGDICYLGVGTADDL